MSANSRVRPATTADIPWILKIAEKRYGPQIEDLGLVEKWLLSTRGEPNVCFLRSDHAFVVSTRIPKFYAPSSPEAGTIFIASENNSPWETLALLRTSAAWYKVQGCKAYRIDSATDYDIEPLALRLGAKPVSTTYALRLA